MVSIVDVAQQNVKELKRIIPVSSSTRPRAKQTPEGHETTPATTDISAAKGAKTLPKE
jgi:hypothetical protein